MLTNAVRSNAAFELERNTPLAKTRQAVILPIRGTGFAGQAARETDPTTLTRIAKAWADQGWPAELDETGAGITAPFNAPSQGPPPWNVYRIAPRSATVVLGVEPGGLTRFTF